MNKFNLLILAVVGITVTASAETIKTAKQWEPTDWSFKNSSCTGNPYDLIAKADFEHQKTGKKIATELFYDGQETWKLRFTGTEPGRWKFVTKSEDKDLDGLTGELNVEPNPGVAGFMTSYGNKWGRLGLDEAFVPQYVSYLAPKDYYQKPQTVDEDIKLFFGEHGFNGFNTFAGCAWFDIEKNRYTAIPSTDPNPDPRTFEAFEMLFKKVHAAGGVVHIWLWGDQQRRQTTKKWGINGPVDQRLQRYICARLGPLPGWSMGYGFDLHEWATADTLRVWHKYMHEHLGWSHFLGARAPKMGQIYDGLDYSSYQQHRPTYDIYVEGIEKRHPGKPTFFEDRFRVRDMPRYVDKDYTVDMTRRGLWHSNMAGGAANIWSYYLRTGVDGGKTPAQTDVLNPKVRISPKSLPYPNKNELKTYARFWENRFKKEMVRNNKLTDGVCLEVPGKFYVFYKEDTSAIKMDLSALKNPLPAIAIDTRADYKEIDLGQLEPDGEHVFKAPHKSDWAIAVGR